jgi:deoxyadenosine/deoxycytidine kinase
MAKQEKTCLFPKKTVICISGMAGTGKAHCLKNSLKNTVLDTFLAATF